VFSLHQGKRARTEIAEELAFHAEAADALGERRKRSPRRTKHDNASPFSMHHHFVGKRLSGGQFVGYIYNHIGYVNNFSWIAAPASKVVPGKSRPRLRRCSGPSFRQQWCDSRKVALSGSRTLSCVLQHGARDVLGGVGTVKGISRGNDRFGKFRRSTFAERTRIAFTIAPRGASEALAGRRRRDFGCPLGSNADISTHGAGERADAPMATREQNTT